MIQLGGQWCQPPAEGLQPFLSSSMNVFREFPKLSLDEASSLCTYLLSSFCHFPTKTFKPVSVHSVPSLTPKISTSTIQMGPCLSKSSMTPPSFLLLLYFFLLLSLCLVPAPTLLNPLPSLPNLNGGHWSMYPSS